MGNGLKGAVREISLYPFDRKSKLYKWVLVEVTPGGSLGKHWAESAHEYKTRSAAKRGLERFLIRVGMQLR